MVCVHFEGFCVFGNGCYVVVGGESEYVVFFVYFGVEYGDEVLNKVIYFKEYGGHFVVVWFKGVVYIIWGVEVDCEQIWNVVLVEMFCSNDVLC